MKRPQGRLKIQICQSDSPVLCKSGEQVDVIKLYGSMELAPLVGLGTILLMS